MSSCAKLQDMQLNIVLEFIGRMGASREWELRGFFSLLQVATISAC